MVPFCLLDFELVCYNVSIGVLAHLVERDIRIVEVRSSSLLHSTNLGFRHNATRIFDASLLHSTIRVIK